MLTVIDWFYVGKNIQGGILSKIYNAIVGLVKKVAEVENNMTAIEVQRHKGTSIGDTHSHKDLRPAPSPKKTAPVTEPVTNSDEIDTCYLCQQWTHLVCHTTHFV